MMKKLKQVSEETRETVLKELSELNLSKYISEAVSGIFEAKMKAADVGAFVQVINFI